MDRNREDGGVIVSCPVCSARVRLDRGRHGGKRIKLRCSRCGEVHQVEVPAAAVKEAATMPGAVQVLVAHSDPALCAAVGEIFAPYTDISWHACHSGEEALATMERLLPQVAVVDVALPGLFAFELVEKVRQRPGLDQVKLILLSSVYNKMAYKRTPNSLYGADDYIEKHHLPTDLVPKIRDLTGLNLSAGPVHGTVALSGLGVAQVKSGDQEQLRRIETVNTLLRSAEESEIEAEAANGVQEALEKALRLARIIVSDIALYNQDRVEEGIRNGTFYAVLANEIEEGRKLFNERVAADVPRRDQILPQAFEQFIERRRSELSRGH